MSFSDAREPEVDILQYSEVVRLLFWPSRLFKSKRKKHCKIGNVEVYVKGKCLTFSRRVSLKNAFTSTPY